MPSSNDFRYATKVARNCSEALFKASNKILDLFLERTASNKQNTCRLKIRTSDNTNVAATVSAVLTAEGFTPANVAYTIAQTDGKRPRLTYGGTYRRRKLRN